MVPTFAKPFLGFLTSMSSIGEARWEDRPSMVAFWSRAGVDNLAGSH